MCCLIPSFAFLLSCKAPVLVVHFSLAAFLQHLEDTLSGARIGRRSGENGITQMVHAEKKEKKGKQPLHTFYIKGFDINVRV